MERRAFLAGSVAAVGGALLGSQAGCRGPAGATAGHDPYERVELGKTGIRVSRLGMGTGTNGWERESDMTRLGVAAFHSLIQQAHERGIRLFDVADIYGTQPYIPQALRAVPRSEYVLATKIWFREGGLPEKDRPAADLLVERFLHELKTDYIDLLLLHCVTSGEWTTELSEQMQTLDKLKQRGVIRALGVSCHSLAALATAAEEPWVESVHARINAFGDRMDGRPDAVAAVLRRIHDAGKGVVGMKIVGGGAYRMRADKIDYTLKYVLNLGCVDCMIVGFERVAQIDDLAARIRKVPLAHQHVPASDWEQAEIDESGKL